jgi:hypothetical protein
LYTVGWGAGAVAPQEGAVQISRMKRRKIPHNTAIVNNTHKKRNKQENGEEDGDEGGVPPGTSQFFHVCSINLISIFLDKFVYIFLFPQGNRMNRSVGYTRIPIISFP